MSCEPIRMADGTTVLAMVKPSSKLTDSDRKILAEWAQFCRDRRAKERELGDRKRPKSEGVKP
jgi:hypothetical protein